MTQMSHVARLMQAIDKLPAEARSLMNALYRKGLNQEQACQVCNIAPEEFEAKRSQALRALMTAVH